MSDHDTRPNPESTIRRATVVTLDWSPLSDASLAVANGALDAWFGVESAPARTAAVAIGGPMGWQSGVVVQRTANLSHGRGLLLWSLSKTVLAAAAFRLVDLGRLTLGRRVVHLLPGTPIDPVATVGQLLSHTAGLPDYGDWPGYHEAVARHLDAPWPLETYLERARSVGPLGPAGGQWRYSNIGYLLVRRIIETTSGLPLTAALARLVFAPLGLSRTSVALTPDDVGHLLFDGAGGSPGIGPPTYHPGWVAHGVVRSTIEETAALFDRLLGGQLLSPGSLASMTTPVVRVAERTSPGRLAWGHGVLLGTGLSIGGVTGHTGAGPGSTTAALRIVNRSGRAITIATAIDDEREHGSAELALRLTAVVLDETEGSRGNQE